MTGVRTFTTRSRPMRWAEMRDERTPLLDVVESFFIHRNDLSPATAATTESQWNSLRSGAVNRSDDLRRSAISREGLSKRICIFDA